MDHSPFTIIWKASLERWWQRHRENCLFYDEITAFSWADCQGQSVLRFWSALQRLTRVHLLTPSSICEFRWRVPGTRNSELASFTVEYGPKEHYGIIIWLPSCSSKWHQQNKKLHMHLKYPAVLQEAVSQGERKQIMRGDLSYEDYWYNHWNVYFWGGYSAHDVMPSIYFESKNIGICIRVQLRANWRNSSQMTCLWGQTLTQRCWTFFTRVSCPRSCPTDM